MAAARGEQQVVGPLAVGARPEQWQYPVRDRDPATLPDLVTFASMPSVGPG